jgi:hypothetical protein
MRTTLVLEDELVRRAKKRAADAGLTLSEVVNNALRESLAGPERKAPRFEMITYGAGGEKVGHEPSEFAEALERDETASMRR